MRRKISALHCCLLNGHICCTFSPNSHPPPPQVYKRYPYHPQNSSFDPEFSLAAEDIAFLAESGFTVVRLYVAWPGVEPAEGIYNSTYLDVSGTV